MKAEELRIGNYVTNSASDVYQITSGAFYLYHTNKTWDVQPISLTEEWLIKFGIGKNNGYPYIFLQGYIKIRNGVYFFKYHNLEVELPYVHTFQNFVHSLTGTELTLK